MFLSKEWEELLFHSAREVLGDVSLHCAEGTAFLSGWSQLQTDDIFSHWSKHNNLDISLLQDKFYVKDVEYYRQTVC